MSRRSMIYSDTRAEVVVWFLRASNLLCLIGAAET